MRELHTITKQLADVRAALKAETGLQASIEDDSFALSVALGSKRLDRSTEGGNVVDEILNHYLAKEARAEIRNLLDRAGDQLRKREVELGEELIVTAAKVAGYGR